MAGDVKLKIGADTKDLEAEFDRAIKKIQNDIKKINAPAVGAQAQQAFAQRSSAAGYPMGGPGPDAARAAIQSKLQLEQRLRDEQRGMRLQEDALNRQKGLLDKLSATQKNITGDLNAQKAAQEQLNRVTETYHRMLQAQSIRTKGANLTLDAIQGGAGPSGSSAGGASGIKSVTSLSGMGQALMGSPTMAFISTAIAGGLAAESARKFYSESGYRAREKEASAFQMQGQGGQRLTSFLGGGANEETMFNPERLQAKKDADEMMKNRLQSVGRLLTHPVQELTGPGGLFGTEATRKEALQEQAQERNEFQAQQYEAIRKGPVGAFKSAVGGQYLQQYQRNLGFQRQTGLSEDAFRGRFTSGITDAGFSQEQGMGMASSIMGAGGSTRSAVGNAATGLQAQRNFDLTNAGQVLGKLSGTLGGSEMSKDALIKVLSEGTRIGVNNADFVEENRKFVEMASNVISQSGATSGADVTQVLSQFGKFFGADKTQTGIEAGKTAFETYRQTSMEQTGPRGTMRAAGMMSDPTIGKLGRESRAALFDMPVDMLKPNEPAIIEMAREAGVTPQALIDAQNKVTGRSANIFKGSDIAIQKLKSLKQKYGTSSSTDTYGPLPEGAQAELTSARGRSDIMQVMEHKEFGQNLKAAGATSEALSSGDTDKANRILQEAATSAKMGEKETGRPGDKTEQLQAEASKLANQLFIDMRTEITPTAKAVADFAAQCAALRAILSSNASAAIKSKALTDFDSGHAMTVDMPTAGSPNSGSGTSSGGGRFAPR